MAESLGVTVRMTGDDVAFRVCAGLTPRGCRSAVEVTSITSAIIGISGPSGSASNGLASAGCCPLEEVAPPSGLICHGSTSAGCSPSEVVAYLITSRGGGVGGSSCTLKIPRNEGKEELNESNIIG